MFACIGARVDQPTDRLPNATREFYRGIRVTSENPGGDLLFGSTDPRGSDVSLREDLAGAGRPSGDRSIGISDDACCIESERLRLIRGHHHPWFNNYPRLGARISRASRASIPFDNKSPEPSPAAFRSLRFGKVRTTPGANE
jgi:hypothetical protein